MASVRAVANLSWAVHVSEEIELKLSLAPEALAGVLASAPLARRGIRFGRPRQMVTSYYDTAKGALHRKGVFLRIREQGRRIEQTVKTAGEGGVLSRRGEWTWPLKTPQPDLDLAATTGLKPLERRARKGGLVKRFASEIARRIAMVETPEATLELALDDGVVRAGRRSVPLLELEIEVKRGDPMAVFALARELIALPGVTIGFATKASRGFELASGAAARAHPAIQPELDEAMEVHEAARSILNAAAAHAAANLQLLAATGAPEAVHQSRVALRRLRAALVLLKEAIPPERRHHLRREAGWLAAELGAARDFDVLALGALKKAAPPPDIAPAFARLVRRVETARRAARAAARAAAVSTRAQSLLLDLSETAALLTPLEGGHSLKELASASLARRYEAVRTAGEGVETMDVEARHHLRLTLKKLRYAADFFAPLYPRKAAKNEIKALGRLQDALGAFNDAAVAPMLAAKALAAAPARAKDPGIETAAAFLAGWAASQGDAAWSEAAARWGAFTEAKPFWD